MKSLKVLTYALLLGMLMAVLAGCNESSGRVGNYQNPENSRIETQWHSHPDFRAEAYQ